jgi:hypothetical protein
MHGIDGDLEGAGAIRSDRNLSVLLLGGGPATWF